MNIGEIAERFIRAAEIDRNTREHVGPAPLRAQQLPYVHDFADKAGWRKEVGDKLEAKADPYAEERKAFWERVASLPTAHDFTMAEIAQAWLHAVTDEGERRALWAWARSKVGGKSFRRWCFQTEGIHPETGRRRKDRALSRISVHLSRKTMQHSATDEIRVLLPDPEIGDVSDTIAEDVGKRDGLDSWMAPDAFASDFTLSNQDFSWSEKRNARRRQLEAKKRQNRAA
jgi:hypothetical protein